MRWGKALGALGALVAVTVLPPVLLLAFVGSPVPTGIGWDLPLTDDTLIRLLSAVVWLLWAQTVGCIVVEAAAATRSSDTGPVRGAFGIQQQLARVLVGAIVTAAVTGPGLSVTATTAAHARPAPDHTPPAPTAPAAAGTGADPGRPTPGADGATTVDPAAAARPAASTVTVRRGDSLWALAETHLGDGERWCDIAAANEGRTMTDGRVFHAGDPLRPGWRLAIPASSASTGAATSRTGARTGGGSGDGWADHTVQPGDTLSQIALDRLGDAHRWPAVFEASRRLDQPVPMTDPDLIYPGQRIDLPGAGTPPPAPRPRARPGPGADPDAAGPDAGPGGRRPLLPGPHQHQPGNGIASLSPRAVDDPVPDASRGPAPSSAEATDETDTGRTGQDTSGLPGWVMPGLVGAGTLLAGAVLLALRRRRAGQHRSRRPGRLIAAPDPELAAVEKSVAVAGDTAAGTVELVDDLLRRVAGALAAGGTALPRLAAVEVTPTAVALHLTDPCSPPAPWVAAEEQRVWRLDRRHDPDTVGPDPGDSPAPWPLLVTVGHDDQDRVWLLNLEDQTVTVTGDRVAAADFARFIAAEVACNPWSRHTALDLVGVAGEVAPISPDRIRVHDHPGRPGADAVAEAVHTIDRLARYDTDTPTARAEQTDPDTWPSRLLIVDHPDSARELAQLIALTAGHPGRTATAVVLSGGAPAGCPEIGLEIGIDDHRQLKVPAVNLAVRAVGLTATEAGGCAALLAHAEHTADRPAPDLPDTDGWRGMATVTGALRPRYRGDRHTENREPSASLLADDDEAYTAVAATTAADLDALAPRVTEAVRDRVADADPGLDADLDAWVSDTCTRPRLHLLGPVTARTSGAALDRRRPYYTELFAYLATRPHGATTDEVAAAFDLAQPRVRTDINKLRSWLGADPATGAPYLPDARHAPSARTRGGLGVYEIVDGLVDVDLFRRLRARGESRGEPGITDLHSALQLVTGRPFEKLRPSGWGWLWEGDRLDQQMVCAIADVAHLVVTHSLRSGDLARARTAAGIAVLAAPDEEVSRLDLAAVLDADGHRREAERVVRDQVCNRSDDGEAPTELPQRTEQILSTRRWLDKQAM
jgi:nucleoid-associated protein YgaU